MDQSSLDESALRRIRERIDALDARLIDLVVERAAVVDEARRLKAAHGVPLYDPARERELLRARAQAAAARGLDVAPIRAIFEALLDLSRGGLPQSST